MTSTRPLADIAREIAASILAIEASAGRNAARRALAREQRTASPELFAAVKVALKG